MIQTATNTACNVVASGAKGAGRAVVTVAALGTDIVSHPGRLTCYVVAYSATTVAGMLTGIGRTVYNSGSQDRKTLDDYVVEAVDGYHEGLYEGLKKPLIREKEFTSVAGLCGLAGAVLITGGIAGALGLSGWGSYAAIQLIHIPSLCIGDVDAYIEGRIEPGISYTV